uniref:Gelsolin-like domain-containing protein n=1 Tax=Entomoneis paludosa TaxID=265537 RepID=A0A6U2ZDQ2_9STRA|mmetsp:Transcript_20031/g.41870  ORF Transcript_20031/g.41870 Transcript_20031/m.41870 type:complete len:426 (+) Transcript_20031:56-1333(+)
MQTHSSDRHWGLPSHQASLGVLPPLEDTLDEQAEETATSSTSHINGSTMDTPLDESNLAHIGSDEDKAAREKAAGLEVNWQGAGEAVGLQIWRVENKRDEHGAPDFGINTWPKSRYGEFYNGDSYIVLHTHKDPDSEAFLYDIYFWIGSESSQDEYGVAAYKANELDDLLGDVPVQHRETEGMESEEFINLFVPYHGVRYLDGGIDSGFRHVEVDEGSVPKMPTRLYHVRRTHKITRCKQVPVTGHSLNQGDAFLLDTGAKILTWYGSSASPFEKERAAEMAYNMVQSRGGHSRAEIDVGDDHAIFWYLMGGKTPIKAADEVIDAEEPESIEPKMWRVHEEESRLKITTVFAEKDSLDSDDVFLLDVGKEVYIWVGKGASSREKQQAMVVVQTHLKNFHREKNTKVSRVLEGQEKRIPGFTAACA